MGTVENLNCAFMLLRCKLPTLTFPPNEPLIFAKSLVGIELIKTFYHQGINGLIYNMKTRRLSSIM